MTWVCTCVWESWGGNCSLQEKGWWSAQQEFPHRFALSHSFKPVKVCHTTHTCTENAKKFNLTLMVWFICVSWLSISLMTGFAPLSSSDDRALERRGEERRGEGRGGEGRWGLSNLSHWLSATQWLSFSIPTLAEVYFELKQYVHCGFFKVLAWVLLWELCLIWAFNSFCLKRKTQSH